MRTNKTKCDFCKSTIKTKSTEDCWMGSPDFLRTDGLNISLYAGGDGQVAYYRDFCGEKCLTDYLVKHKASNRTP